ncbi:MAG: FAD-dependent oxidoreductase [bacterium]|nr:FAD-dependent oxidoreductase [bacterium]
MDKPHIAILGAGPTGLEAALAAAERGFPFTLYEAADQVAGHVDEWGHVRLFTSWDLDASPRMRRALASAGHDVPEGAACPTGSEMIENVLAPIAELPQIQGSLRLGTRVRRIGRQSLLKHEEIGSAQRAAQPFRLLVAVGGDESLEQADVVLDCTGNSEPNCLGDGGIPAPGEESLDGAVRHIVPDVAGEAAQWSGRTVLLIGAGYSAQTAARDLAGQLESGNDLRVIWAVRGEQPDWGFIDDDPLPGRAKLAADASRLAADPPAGMELKTGVVVEAVKRSDDLIIVTLRHVDGTTETVDVDRILALTGHVGDHLLYRQLQVHECYATSGPMKLAAALMGTEGGDCMQQTSMGPETLKNPEPGFFILGAKSYGRRTDYLMRVGWQQVDEVFQLLEE